MRRVLGYENGRPIWSENEPATPLMHASRGGQLVVGEYADGRTAKRIAQAEAARRYRERKAAS